VKLLVAQGLSNRQIAKTLGVDRRTIDRDISGANAPSSGANAAPKSKPKPTQEQIAATMSGHLVWAILALPPRPAKCPRAAVVSAAGRPTPKGARGPRATRRRTGGL
jgi:hypothetical protein